MRLLPNGVKAFVETALNDAGLTWKEKAPWVFRVDVGVEEVWLCIVDFCESCQHMTREWRSRTITRRCGLSFIQGQDRSIPQEDWLPVVSLSELLTGSASLNSLPSGQGCLQSGNQSSESILADLHKGPEASGDLRDGDASQSRPAVCRAGR